jgi:hypothetical protein
MFINYSYPWLDSKYKPPFDEVCIDWTHPMAQGLSAFYIFNERAPAGVTNLVRPQRWTVSSLGCSYTNRGIKFDGNGYLTTLQNCDVITKYPYTVIANCKNSTDQQGYFLSVGTSATNYYTYMGYYASLDRAYAWGKWGGTGIQMNGANNHWADRNNFHLLTWVSTASTSHTLYFDLSSVDTDATDIGSTFTWTNNYMVIGAAGTTGTSKVGANGEMEFAAVYDGRALSVAEQRSLRDYPYQFLIPKWEVYHRWKTTSQGPSVGSNIFGGSIFNGPITTGPIVR